MMDSKVIKFMETESKGGCQRLGEGELVFNGDRVSVLDNDNVLWVVVMLEQQ